MRDVEVRWARYEGKSIAYEVFGTGPVDILFNQNWCPIDLMWDLPQLESFLDGLARIGRVIVFEGLSNGASDTLPDLEAATIEARADAALTVLDAVRAPRVVLFDATGSGQGLLLAATYPERVQSLILFTLRTSFPEVRSMTPAQRAHLAMALHGVRSLEMHDPRYAHDPVLRAWWGRARRLLNTPEQALENVEFAASADYSSALPAVRVPTLVLHRQDDRMYDIETSREEASRIPGARFVELPGSEHDLFLGDTRPVFTAIEEFLAEPETASIHDRPLATVLFTDIVASTEQLAARGDSAWRGVLDEHSKTTARIVGEFRGRVVRETGDGVLATFDGPARAVRCATALLAAAADDGITLRAGLHAGEIELRQSDIAGIVVHIASRITALASADEVFASRTVVDLTAGSGLQFDPRGEHELKGVPGTWAVFATQPTA